MALPSGYTKLDYIESSGTQYINTGFKPNQNTRCVIDIENLSSAQAAFFGARASQTAASFTYFSLTATTGRSDYGSSKQSMTFTNTVGRYTVDQNKNVCTANGVTATGTANTFQLTNNLYLMAVNQADAAIQNAKLKLYSAKVYDNGTLVRDFIPCKNASGAIGLWDNVNSVFYANAGTGTFSTGKKHKTLIDGTGYEIKSGRVLIAGTGYDIKKGRTLIGGTGYDIKLGVPVGELAVGSSVYMNVNGVRTEFIVGHQGNLTLSYSDSQFSSGTWLLMKDVYAKNTFYNLVDVFNEFFSKLDATIQALAKPIRHYDGLGSIVNDKVATPTIASIEGGSGFKYAKMAYFTTKSQNIAFFNGVASSWWLDESIWYSSSLGGNEASMITSDGDRVGTLASYTEGFRPLLVLPPDATEIDDNFNIIPA